MPQDRDYLVVRLRVSTKQCNAGTKRCVRRAIAALGWIEEKGLGQSDVIWSDSPVCQVTLRALPPGAAINRYVGLGKQTCKVSTELNLRQYRRLWHSPIPSSAVQVRHPFVPETLLLPDEDYSQIEGVHILKPDGGSQGLGISLVSCPDQVSEALHAAEVCAKLKRQHEISDAKTGPARRDLIEAPLKIPRFILQRYLPNPLLCDGCKCDLRLYVIVQSFAPKPQAVLCREGIVRTSSQLYSAPREDNLADTAMHLTNFSLRERMSADRARLQTLRREIEGLEKERGDNRQIIRQLKELRAQAEGCEARLHPGCLAEHCTEEDEEDEEDDDAGEPEAKRLASDYLDQVAREQHVDPDELWDSIAGVVSAATLALVPSMIRASISGGEHCFALLGADVILDESLKPHFLEWNSSPSLKLTKVGPEGNKIENELDAAVKVPVVAAALMTAAGIDWDLADDWCMLPGWRPDGSSKDAVDVTVDPCHTFIDLMSNWKQTQFYQGIVDVYQRAAVGTPHKGLKRAGWNALCRSMEKLKELPRQDGMTGANAMSCASWQAVAADEHFMDSTRFVDALIWLAENVCDGQAHCLAQSIADLLEFSITEPFECDDDE